MTLAAEATDHKLLREALSALEQVDDADAMLCAEQQDISEADRAATLAPLLAKAHGAVAEARQFFEKDLQRLVDAEVTALAPPGYSNPMDAVVDVDLRQRFERLPPDLQRKAREDARVRLAWARDPLPGNEAELARAHIAKERRSQMSELFNSAQRDRFIAEEVAMPTLAALTSKLQTYPDTMTTTRAAQMAEALHKRG
jgi:hypothetical protein